MTTYAALKERAQRLNGKLTGHRFLFDTVQVGSGELALAPRDVARARAELRAVRDEHATSWRQLQFVASLQERLAGVGVLSREDAERWAPSVPPRVPPDCAMTCGA